MSIDREVDKNKTRYKGEEEDSDQLRYLCSDKGLN